jgi:hypothetical protein
MSKIIFLDIDGPVIPIDVPLYESVYRTTYNPDSIQYLNLLCEETGAKIVTNSFHNYQDFMDGTLKDDLVKWGLNSNFVHDSWRTIFPAIDYTVVNSNVRGIGRLIAIEKYIEDKKVDNWVCFDDRKFTEMPNLIHIEDGRGIKEHHFEKAIDLLSK